MENTKVQITGTYITLCFCEKPELKPVRDVNYYPRFEFLKVAKEFCRLNNLTDIIKNKGKSALATSSFSCKHNKQQVRIDWDLQY